MGPGESSSGLKITSSRLSAETFASGAPVAFVAYYCVWGTFQQYALNGFFVNRLSGAARPDERRWVPLLAAILFAAVHVPNWFLVTVTFTLGPDALSLVDRQMRRVVEPGRFRILVGNSSRDQDLKETWLTVV